MPFDYYSKVRAKEQRKESLAKYIVDTKGKMSQVNHDISFYKTCQRLENQQDSKFDFDICDLEFVRVIKNNSLLSKYLDDLKIFLIKQLYRGICACSSRLISRLRL